MTDQFSLHSSQVENIIPFTHWMNVGAGGFSLGLETRSRCREVFGDGDVETDHVIISYASRPAY